MHHLMQKTYELADLYKKKRQVYKNKWIFGINDLIIMLQTITSIIMKKYMRFEKHTGFTLLETIFAIALGAIMIASATYALSERANDIRDKAFAEQLALLQKAATAFSKDNYISLKENSPQVFDMTVLNSYISSPITQSPYGHQYQIVTKPIMNSGVKDGFDAIVIAGNPTHEIDFKRIPGIAGLAGADVGYVKETGGSQEIIGAFGGWKRNISDFGAITLSDPEFASIAHMTDLSVTSDYLYRNQIPGQPQLNRMNTNIDMNHNDINDINDLSANKLSSNALNIEGDADIKGTTSTNFLYSKEINVVENARIGQNLTVNGEIRSNGKIIGDNGIETNIFYDQDDNAYYIDPSDLSVMKKLNVIEDTNLNGETTATQGVVLGKIAVEGAVCAPDGKIGSDTTGQVYSCKNGRWISSSAQLAQNNCQWIRWGTPGHGISPGSYWQGICPVGKYIAGISLRGWDAGYATYQHNALCCNP